MSSSIRRMNNTLPFVAAASLLEGRRWALPFEVSRVAAFAAGLALVLGQLG